MLLLGKCDQAKRGAQGEQCVGGIHDEVHIHVAGKRGGKLAHIERGGAVAVPCGRLPIGLADKIAERDHVRNEALPVRAAVNDAFGRVAEPGFRSGDRGFVCARRGQGAQGIAGRT